jgi:hypothetical protein
MSAIGPEQKKLGMFGMSAVTGEPDLPSACLYRYL